MADGVLLNDGTGTVTATTDDCGVAGHTQVVKLAISTDGSATLIPAEANNGLDVDVTRVIPGTTATALGKADGAAYAAGDVGVAAMAVRKDTAAVDAGVVNGDYTPVSTDSSGRLWVNASGAAVPVTDNAGSLTVDGTVAISGTVTVDGSGVTQPVSHAALTELAAAINASSQMDVNIAASGATVPVSNAGLTALNGAIAGTEVQVDIVAAPTLTVAGVAAEDAAASGNPVLVGGRYDSVARVLETGDVGAFAVNASGQILVEIAAGAGSGGTAAADDADFTAGTTSGTPIMGVYESTPTSVTDGDLGTVGITQTRAMKVAIASGGISGKVDDAAFTAASDEGVLIMGVASSDTVDANDAGAIAMTTARAMHVAVQSIAAGNTNIGDVDVASIAAGDNNIGNVDIVTMPNVTLAAGTNTNEVVGDAADDAATAGNPVLIGGVAVETDGTDPTTVSAEGDTAYLRTDRARRLLVSEHHPRSFFTSADYGAAQTNTSVQAAPGAGLSLYLTDIIISNGATAGNITLLDGSGGTVKFEIYPAINGGVSLSLRQPIRLTANTALCITSTTVTTHSVNIGGYIAP